MCIVMPMDYELKVALFTMSQVRNGVDKLLQYLVMRNKFKNTQRRNHRTHLGQQ